MSFVVNVPGIVHWRSTQPTPSKLHLQKLVFCRFPVPKTPEKKFKGIFVIFKDKLDEIHFFCSKSLNLKEPGYEWFLPIVQNKVSDS